MAQEPLGIYWPWGGGRRGCGWPSPVQFCGDVTASLRPTHQTPQQQLLLSLVQGCRINLTSPSAALSFNPSPPAPASAAGVAAVSLNKQKSQQPYLLVSSGVKAAS